jgi:hypothetical protein
MKVVYGSIDRVYGEKNSRKQVFLKPQKEQLALVCCQSFFDEFTSINSNSIRRRRHIFIVNERRFFVEESNLTNPTIKT